MPSAVAYDAVTLRHFAAVGRLDVCEHHCAESSLPRWTDAVQQEIERAYNAGAAYCRTILDAAWLGSPYYPDLKDLQPIYDIRVGLNGGQRPPTEHAGEAESIYFAEQKGGFFVTDDFPAHDFAARRPMLAGRVLDSVDILRHAVASTFLTAEQASQIASAIYDADRYLRRSHPTHPDPGYFR